MALDDFTSEDSTETSNSSSTNSKEPRTDTGNTPGYARQCFVEGYVGNQRVSPRAIRYEIESIGLKWVTQFSSRRVDEGEIVMYADSVDNLGHGNTIAVFTTILSAFDRPYGVEQQDIWITEWDRIDNKLMGSEAIIEPEPEWSEELLDELHAMITMKDEDK